MVFAVGRGAPTGLVFDANPGGDGTTAHMCDWCHFTGTGNQVGLLTAELNSRKRLGVNVCRDLSCKDKVEEAANLGGKNVVLATEKLLGRIAQFAGASLKIDLTGAGR